MFIKDKEKNRNVYLQQYLDNCGYIIRTIVVGQKVVGSLKIHYPFGEWRTHRSYCSWTEEIEITCDLKKQCLKTSQTLGTDFCEIDILSCVDGIDYVLEVNAVPEINIFYKKTEINLAKEILQHLLESIELIK